MLPSLSTSVYVALSPFLHIISYTCILSSFVLYLRYILSSFLNLVFHLFAAHSARYVSLSSDLFDAFLHNKSSCLQAYSIINAYRYFIARPFSPTPPSHALALSFPSLHILYTFYIPSCVRRMFTRPSRPFLSPHWKLIPRPRARSLCISKRTYALAASSTIP